MGSTYNTLMYVMSHDEVSLDQVFSSFYVASLEELIATINAFFSENLIDLIENDTFFNRYHSFLYVLDSKLSNPDDVLKLKVFVNSTIKKLKDNNKKYNKKIDGVTVKKDRRYYLTCEWIKQLQSNLDSINVHLYLSSEPDDICMLWYVINELKNPDYLFYIFEQCPELINVKDKEKKSIFSAVCDYYLNFINDLDKEDIKYYKRVITLFLEHPKLRVSDTELVNILMEAEKVLPRVSVEGRQNVNYLITEINRHYSTINADAKKTALDYVKQDCPVDIITNLANRSKGERRDLQEMFTISIDRSSSNKIGNMLFDDAISFKLLGNGEAILYVHVPDVDFYVKKDSETDMFMRSLGESVYAKNYKTPLLNPTMANLCSLRQGEVRPAITFRIRLDQSGEIKDIDFVESVVRVNYNLTTRDALTFMGNNSDNRLFVLNDMYEFAKAMRKRRKETIGKRSKSNIIVDEFNIAPDMGTAAYFLERGIVFPYKNFAGKKSPFAREDVAKVADYIDHNDLDAEQKEFLTSVFDANHRVYYDTVNHGNHSFNGVAMGNVGNPLREYISLETLRLIKDLIINKEGNVDYWESRIERDCIEFTETTARIKTLYK